MNRINLTFFTVIIGVLLVVVFFQMEKPRFKVENKFIVIPKNVIASNNMDHIVNNIVNIASNQQESDLVKSSRARVEVKKIANTSMFEMSVLAQSEKEVEELNDQITYRMLDKIDQYYKVRADVKVDLLNKSEVSEDSLFKVYPIIFWSLVGILVSILVVMLIEIIIPKKKVNNQTRVIKFNDSQNFESGNNRNQFLASEEMPTYDLKSSLEQRKKVNPNYEFLNSAQNNNLEKDSSSESVVNSFNEKGFEIKKVNFVDRSTNLNSQNSTASAPNNLPVVEDATESKISVSDSDEPTEEELKARLNSLLSGKL